MNVAGPAAEFGAERALATEEERARWNEGAPGWGTGAEPARKNEAKSGPENEEERERECVGGQTSGGEPELE